MGNLICEKVARRQLKKRYKGLDSKQKQYIKAKEKFEILEKDLASFYLSAKRLSSGAVDFKNMTESELDYFEWLNREKTKAMRAMERLEKQIDVDFTLNYFREINLHSESF